MVDLPEKSSKDGRKVRPKASREIAAGPFESGSAESGRRPLAWRASQLLAGRSPTLEGGRKGSQQKTKVFSYARRGVHRIFNLLNALKFEKSPGKKKREHLLNVQVFAASHKKMPPG
ncbi:hypothetical protein KK141_16740 [Dyella sp. LX-66]|uniref:hypothetical protein n=1 Tax=unclassified Dyella TaxID=2634549 RepID=UPI001BE04FBE|nr:MULTISPECIES: hypothetical protein [unclassified Dyella]MBT2117679.1 hypothetical protein [Dyella sp. LX-1]MBT2141194.1 hypothetical protein [Dyella sp. LX-66]